MTDNPIENQTEIWIHFSGNIQGDISMASVSQSHQSTCKCKWKPQGVKLRHKISSVGETVKKLECP